MSSNGRVALESGDIDQLVAAAWAIGHRDVDTVAPWFYEQARFAPDDESEEWRDAIESRLALLRDTTDTSSNGASSVADLVDQIRRALLDDAQDTRDGDGPAREEIAGTGGLLHRGQAHLFFGDRGGGKTLAVKVTTLSAAAHGAKVLYLDHENGQALTRDRIECILDANPAATRSTTAGSPAATTPS